MNNNFENYKFIFNWILKDQLAVGSSPILSSNLNFLKEKKIKHIIGLCAKDEIGWHKNITKDFSAKRISIPDSNSQHLPSFKQLSEIYEVIKKYIDKEAIFIHCFASVERSPLICILLIMNKYKIDVNLALDYVSQKHKYTNPTNAQLRLLTDFNKNLINNSKNVF